MSNVSEIKCPTCGEWGNWTSKIDERCTNCGEQLDPRRYAYEEDRRVTTERIKNESYLIIKDTDDPIVQMFKQFVNWLKWATFYGISEIYFVIAIIIILYGLVMI